MESDPRWRVAIGMSQDEVSERLGTPHNTRKRSDGAQTWEYYCGVIGLGVLGIEFDVRGNVIRKWLSD